MHPVEGALIHTPTLWRRSPPDRLLHDTSPTSPAGRHFTGLASGIEQHETVQIC
jgi:hypothetical protein